MKKDKNISNKENGLIIKKMADKFWIDAPSGVVICTARGNLKENGVFVGDKVCFSLDELNIEKVFERRNLLIRPQMANLCQLFIVVSCEPAPDFLMLDKMIIFCLTNGVEPIILLNKIDKSNKHQNYLENVYSKHFKFIAVSAHNKQNVEEIKNLLKNNISAFAGQSGVGKSALINAIFGDETTKEGYLSAKITRGKNTTRHVSLYKLSPKTYIADTPGFSALDEKLLPINENQLPYYYPEFLPLLKECKFKSCLHYKENIKDCAVKRALESGEVDKERYNRYITILNSLKEKLPY